MQRAITCMYCNIAIIYIVQPYEKPSLKLCDKFVFLNRHVSQDWVLVLTIKWNWIFFVVKGPVVDATNAPQPYGL
jgi:hypothetical protein